MKNGNNNKGINKDKAHQQRRSRPIAQYQYKAQCLPVCVDTKMKH